MENDIGNEIEYIVECIQKYMEGNEEYYEIIEVVVDALNKFRKLHVSNTLKTKIIFFISKLTTFIKCPGLFSDNQYLRTMECFEEDFDFYLDAQDKLNKYIRICNKNKTYPCLDMAYILYLQLSFLFRDIIAYTSYIRTLENGYINGYVADKKVRSDSILAEKEDIKKLLMYIGERKED